MKYIEDRMCYETSSILVNIVYSFLKSRNNGHLGLRVATRKLNSFKFPWNDKFSPELPTRRGSRNIRQGGPDRLPHGDISEFRSY